VAYLVEKHIAFDRMNWHLSPGHVVLLQPSVLDTQHSFEKPSTTEVAILRWKLVLVDGVFGAGSGGLASPFSRDRSKPRHCVDKQDKHALGSMYVSHFNTEEGALSRIPVKLDPV
jgi:hypothetical protein